LLIGAKRQSLSRPSRFSTAATVEPGISRHSAIGFLSRHLPDAARLAKWFVYLGRQRSLLKTITAQLRAGHAIPVQRLTARLIKNGNAVNNEVIALGFNFCRLKLTRYE
jgi:hypothetical protein